MSDYTQPPHPPKTYEKEKRMPNEHNEPIGEAELPEPIVDMFDEWNEVTGHVIKGSAVYGELLAMLKDAYNAGLKDAKPTT